MRFTKSILLMLSLFILYNCSTPYQPKGMLGGYSEEKVLVNLYKVAFKGNQHTKPDVVQNYLLYRCAELTKEHGYKYFGVVNEEHHFDEFVSREQHGEPFKARGSASGGLKVYANPDLKNPTSSTNYTAVLYIKFYNDVEEDQKKSLFNADEVMTDLGSIIKK